MAPWFDSDCVDARRKVRSLERKWVKTNDAIHKQHWQVQIRALHDMYRHKAQKYWQLALNNCKDGPRKCWRSINGMLGRVCSDVEGTGNVSDLIADDFACSFTSKVADIRRETASASHPHYNPCDPACSFIEFDILTVADTIELINKSANKKSQLDPIPTWLVKELVVLLSPFITTLFNRCLTAYWYNIFFKVRTLQSTKV